METILAITSNTSCAIKLIACDSQKEAICRMKSIYDKLRSENCCDLYNTFLDEEMGYAQIVSGLEQTEFRIGKIA